jgi:subtilisin
VNARGPYAEKWDDDNGHGTHCAGISDAVDNGDGVVGVSTKATLHAVKVLDNGGSGSWSDVAAGIEYTADQGWDVGSMSIGGGKSQTIKDACQYAADRGVLLVAAAGNDSSNVEGSAPATYSTVMAISATDKNDDLASFSNYGDDIELAAPGVNIYSTYAGGGYDTLSGTSMACPHVSGAGGQLMAAGSSRTEVRSTLKSSAEDIGLSSSEMGAGLLDIEAALGGGSDGNTAPAVDSLSLSEVETGDSDAEFDASWQVSDADGDLRQVELTLTDSTDGESEDSATVSASGDSASGTTRLVATGEDGSGNQYNVSLTVTDENGNTGSETATEAENESAPTVDSLSVSEVETDDGDAEFDAVWAVSDPDGELATVDLTLTDTNTKETDDSASVSVSSADASDTTRLFASGDDGSGHTYDVEVIVTDDDGQTASATKTVTESEGSPPSIDSYTVTEAGSPNPHVEITADWAVSDSDGDLDTVTIDVIDADTGTVVDSATDDVSGSDAAGSDQFTVKHADGETFDVQLTVSDGSAATSDMTQTKQVTE